MKKLALVALYVISIILTAAITSHMLTKSHKVAFGVALDEAQAMLWFNHLLEFREIESDLAKGCSTEALEKTRISIDGEMKLLSSFHKKNANTWVNKYISDRDSMLLSQLESFKSKYGNSWTVPQCAK